MILLDTLAPGSVGDLGGAAHGPGPITSGGLECNLDSFDYFCEFFTISDDIK